MAKVRMSDDGRDRWMEFAQLQGVSLSAFLEACAEALPQPGEVLDPRMVAVIAAARAIDVERRRRG